MNSRHPSEQTRYTLYRIGAHAAWWGAFAWICLLTWANIHNPLGSTVFQRISGAGIIFTVGIGIALGLTLSRMRLTKTILHVFEAGERVAGLRAQAAEEKAEERARAAVGAVLESRRQATEEAAASRAAFQDVTIQEVNAEEVKIQDVRGDA